MLEKLLQLEEDLLNELYGVVEVERPRHTGHILRALEELNNQIVAEMQLEISVRQRQKTRLAY